MEAKSKKPAHDSASQSEPTDLPEWWSAQRKTELVLRLLRGESLDSVSRNNQVPAHELECWKRAFL
jgi:transposase